PAFGQVEIHGDGNVGHRLAGQGLLEGGLEGLIEPLLGGGRQRRERTKRHGPDQAPRHLHKHCNLPLMLSRPVQISPCCAVSSLRGLRKESVITAASSTIPLTRFCAE